MPGLEPQNYARWYALWTRPKHENFVQQQLVSKSIEAFLPTIMRWSRWKDRRKKIYWPLFAGYCFARFDAANSLPILKCAGVLRIVSFDGRPAPIADDEVNSLRVLVGTDLRSDPCPLLREGTVVEVIHGPLRGIIGRLLRKNAGRATVVISVDLIGQAVSVVVDAADIKPH